VVAMAESLMMVKLLVVDVAEEADIAGATMEGVVVTMEEEAEMATKAATVAAGMVAGDGE
jgi:hypothetical protein